MADCCSPTFLFVLIRAVHYTACLLLLAAYAFDALVLPALASPISETIRKRWEVLESRWIWLLMPVIAISGIAWFAVLCVNMSGLPFREAMKPDTIGLVWSKTHFGRIWQVRFILWMGAGVLPAGPFLRMPRIFRGMAVWTNLILAGALAASLAWAGHGQDGGRWHLLADAVHLFVAGLWPMGLAPFGLFLFEVRKLPPPRRRPLIAAITRRFSMMSLCSVSLLAITGFINGCFLIGTCDGLFHTNYGKVLLVKLSLLVLAVLIGSVNLLRLKPRLTNAGSEEMADVSAAALQWNVAGELLLGLIVLVVTAILGLMAPGHG